MPLRLWKQKPHAPPALVFEAHGMDECMVSVPASNSSESTVTFKTVWID